MAPILGAETLNRYEREKTMAKRNTANQANGASTEASPKEKKLAVVSGRMDTVLRNLASLEKTAGYEELGEAERKKIGETLHSHVSRVLNSFETGKRAKVTQFQF